MNQAVRDLDDIYAYIAGNLLEPGIAAEMVDALESEIEKAKSPSSKSKKCFPIRISPYLKYL